MISFFLRTDADHDPKVRKVDRAQLRKLPKTIEKYFVDGEWVQLPQVAYLTKITLVRDRWPQVGVSRLGMWLRWRLSLEYTAVRVQGPTHTISPERRRVPANQ